MVAILILFIPMTSVSVFAAPFNNGKITTQWEYIPRRQVMTSPLLVDINNDGLMETLFMDTGGRLYCINAYGKVNWTLKLPEVPITELSAVDIDNDQTAEYLVYGSPSNNIFVIDVKERNYTSFSIGTNEGMLSPALPVIDIDDDGAPEIIILTSEGFLMLSSLDGRIENKVPVNDSFTNAPAIGDIDEDNAVEIVLASIGGTLYVFSNSLELIYKHERAILPPVYLTPILADVDNDHILEILLFSAYEIRIFDYTKASFILTFRGFSGYITKQPAIGDFNGDGILDIMFATAPTIRENVFQMIILSCNGKILAFKEIKPRGSFSLSFVLTGDYDNDHRVDLVIGVYYPEFSLVVLTSKSSDMITNKPLTVVSTGSIGNADTDNTTELVLAGVLITFEGEIIPDILTIDFNGTCIYWSSPFGTPQRTSSQASFDKDLDLLNDIIETLIGTSPTSSDTDNDGLPDGWEFMNHLDPLNSTDSTLDDDGDSLTNIDEYKYHTDPFDNDTDDDGLTDGEEVAYNTSPLDNDTDGDSLSDYAEIYVYHTNATNPDTDGDEMADGWEVMYGLNATKNDANEDLDGDGLSNIEEWNLGTMPNDTDTDNDDLSDSDELARKTSPLDPDTDDDRLLDGEEIALGTNATNPDTDGDGLLDGQEVYIYHTDPRSNDTDNDGMPDNWEIKYNLNPTDPGDASEDKDDDGLINVEEYRHGADPTVKDTDGDGVSDGDEVNKYGTDPASKDTDKDGLDDYEEIFEYGTDPTNPDTDGDGYTDYFEIKSYTDPLDPNSNPEAATRLVLAGFGIIIALIVIFGIIYPRVKKPRIAS